MSEKVEVKNEHGWRSVADPPPEGWWVETKIVQDPNFSGLDWCFIHRRLLNGVWEDAYNQKWADRPPTHWREIP